MSRRLKESLYLLAAIAVLAALVPACRTRDPEAAGVLADDVTPAAPTVVASGVAAGGDWIVTCKPVDSEPDPPSYTLAVTGAVSGVDQSQEVLVSVVRMRASGQAVLATRARGHGALALHGTVFVGFTTGLLTAEPAGATYAGVLTLAQDASASAIKVDCTLVKGTRG